MDLKNFSVKEDSQTLYGFFDEQERELFKQLISVSGVGTNTARMMLSSMTSNELVSSIASSNVTSITTSTIEPLTRKLMKDYSIQKIFISLGSAILIKGIVFGLHLGQAYSALTKRIIPLMKLTLAWVSKTLGLWNI